MKHTISVLGAGAWGTALALTAARAGHDVRLWARDTDTVSSINNNRQNPRYLPGITLDMPLNATSDLHVALRATNLVLAVVPAQSLQACLLEAKAHVPKGIPLVLCAKGIEKTTGRLMSEMARQTLAENPIAVLSGPSFALDVARGLPTAVTIAADNADLAADIASLLSGNSFRCYSSTDIKGVEAGGALKNVLAIAVGAVRGKGLGASAEAALITRGFVELRRLAESLGGQPETPLGLSGLGDLILTCSSPQSRNFSYGMAMGRGENLNNRLLAEGVATAFIAAKIAEEREIEAPITKATAAILNGEVDIDQAIAALLSRPLKSETT
jgi:glycerol-3-phosphate dehydrogenase (NAD(P)+)